MILRKKTVEDQTGDAAVLQYLKIIIEVIGPVAGHFAVCSMCRTEGHPVCSTAIFGISMWTNVGRCPDDVRCCSLHFVESLKFIVIVSFELVEKVLLSLGFQHAPVLAHKLNLLIAKINRALWQPVCL